MDVLLFSLFWVFGWVILLVVVWHLRGVRRERRLERMHKERMLALEKGVPLPELPEYDEPRQRPAITEALAQLRLNPRWPLGLGALCIMLGLGVSTALWLSQDDSLNRIWSLGLIGVFLGVGLMLHYVLTRPASPRV